MLRQREKRLFGWSGSLCSETNGLINDEEMVVLVDHALLKLADVSQRINCALSRRGDQRVRFYHRRVVKRNILVSCGVVEQ